jgi:hypothetical protein
MLNKSILVGLFLLPFLFISGCSVENPNKTEKASVETGRIVIRRIDEDTKSESVRISFPLRKSTFEQIGGECIISDSRGVYYYTSVSCYEIQDLINKEGK